LLTGAYTPEEKGRAQGFNDMTIFGVGLLCSFAAGAMLESLGWQQLNLVLLPWLSLCGVALVWFGVKSSASLHR
jgi:MFS family permease